MALEPHCCWPKMTPLAHSASRSWQDTRTRRHRWPRGTLPSPPMATSSSQLRRRKAEMASSIAASGMFRPRAASPPYTHAPESECSSLPARRYRRTALTTCWQPVRAPRARCRCRRRRPSCDVDAIAKQVAIAFNHVAYGDADTKTHLAAGGIRHVPGAQAFLDVDRASHGFDSARKFGKNSVTGGVENTSAGFGDEIVRYLSVGREPPQRFLFVLRDQPAVAGNIGRKNRRDLALHEGRPRTTIYGRRMPPETPGCNRVSAASSSWGCCIYWAFRKPGAMNG